MTEAPQLAVIRQFAASMSQPPLQAAQAAHMRRLRSSKKAQAAGAQRPHKGQYLKGCQCDWCAAYRERAREYGREGARRSSELQGVAGRCRRCDDPIHGNSRLCEFCRQPLARVRYATCVICSKVFVARGSQERKTCGQADCRRKYQDVRVRNREHLRRSSVSDITPEQELAMRKRARKCPLCGVRLTSKRGLPNSKHLDHILPISQGGTHTHGNVRITCADCNLRRPKDGRDFEGQLTLWAQGPAPVSRPNGNCGEIRGTCRKGLHPWIPENIEYSGTKRKCKPCREAIDAARRPPMRPCKCRAQFRPGSQYVWMCPACTDAHARKAAELHASGLPWGLVAICVGFSSDEGVRYAAERIGYKPEPKPAPPKPRRLCPDCDTALPPGKGPRDCPPCKEAKAWRAVRLRESGLTLRAIADQLGLASITSVTNLMKTVVAIETKIGRPAA